MRARQPLVALHECLAPRAEDVSGDRLRRVLPRSRFHLRRHLPEVESRRAAIEADVARLRDTEVQVRTFRVHLDLREQRAEELAPAPPPAHEHHVRPLRGTAYPDPPPHRPLPATTA